ncbi:MAG: hypothetical protein EPO12_01560 [Aquabacterium sp.]|nr:MAG: hypothetical protein EPO12_01560 [Aquabacterium sp.]
MAKPVDHIATRLKILKQLTTHLEAVERTGKNRAVISKAMQSSVESLVQEIFNRSRAFKSAKDEIKWRSGNAAARAAYKQALRVFDGMKKTDEDHLENLKRSKKTVEQYEEARKDFLADFKKYQKSIRTPKDDSDYDILFKGYNETEKKLRSQMDDAVEDAKSFKVFDPKKADKDLVAGLKKKFAEFDVEDDFL